VARLRQCLSGKSLSEMGIGHITLIYPHITVNIWLCLKYKVHMNTKLLMRYKKFKTYLGYVELCYGCNNFMNNVYSHFIKIIYFFMTGLWTQNILSLQFL
jgi:hypothetical protein